MRLIWMDGVLTEWEHATVHVWQEVAIRGVSAFEGVVCLWQPGLRRHVAVALRQHWKRLERSASAIDVCMPCSRQDLERVLLEASHKFIERDFYARPTVFARSGRTSSAPDASSGWYVGAFPVDVRSDPRPMSASFLWPGRSSGLVPSTAKTGGSYLDFRVAAGDRARRHVDATLVVDPEGHLVEADGAGVLVVDDEEVLVPDAGAYALNSVTRRILVGIADEAGLPVVHRRVHSSEAIGSALVLGGTLCGARTAIVSDTPVQPSEADVGVAQRLVAAYYRLIRREDHNAWLHPIGVA